MPLSVQLLVVAVVVALGLWLSSGEKKSVGRFAVTAVGLWVAMIVLAIALVTVGTLLFGR